MTEEEIRPIAEDYVEEYCHCPDGEYTDGSLVCAGIGTALIVSRQLEKQIQIDAEQIRALQKDKGELTDRVRELEAQNKEIENYFVESAGYGRDKVINFMDIVNKALAQKEKRTAELEAQIEKLIDFVLSKTECCDVCPMTDTCINSEGTCPYAGILAKGEEVTREWLMQFISKEIKEK